jgi:hypothetical protein
VGLAAACCGSAFAQSLPERRVVGLVTNAETHAPVADATLSAGDRRATTDAEGRFTLLVPAGRVLIEVSALNYYPLSTTLDLSDLDALDVSFALVPKSAFTASVDVVAAKDAVSAPASVDVAPIEVLHTPGALDNVFRTLQTLPGVSAAEESGSRLTVRGGAPDQNLTIMDGVEIHDPYRLYGLTSAFNPETIQAFDLATGGFSVKYGDRLSSLLLVENRNGTRESRLAGSASLSITDANMVLEGRLPGARGSWLVSARRTYYDLVASRVAHQQFPRFDDVQGKGTWDLTSSQTISVFGLRSRQAAALDLKDDNARGTFQDDTRNDLGWLRYDASIGARAHTRTIVAYSNSVSTSGVDAAIANRSRRSNAPDAAVGTSSVVLDRSLAVRDTSVRQEVAWAVGSHVVETGGELHRLSTDLAFQVRGDRNPTATNGSSIEGGAGLPDSLLSTRNVSRAGGWLLDRWQASSAASIEAGMRVDHAGVNGETQFSPRVSTLVTLAPRMRLRAAIGRYTQSPGYEKLIQSDYLLDLTGPTAKALRSEQAIQTSVGVERDLGRSAVVRVEGYYKRSDKLLIGRLETAAEQAARLARYDFPSALASSVPTDPVITTVPTNDGSGRAYGLDVFVSRPTAPVNARLRGWASYTFGRAELEAYGRRYPSEYDRRHAFSSVVSYRLFSHWEIASTTRVASGFPRTLPLGLRVAATEDTLDTNGNGITDELLPSVDKAGLPVYEVNFGGVSNLNSGRLPLFARVDVRATWHPGGRSGRWELYVEVINVLNRQNAGTLDPRLQYDPASDQPRIVETPDQSIPRLPTIGLRFHF